MRESKGRERGEKEKGRRETRDGNRQKAEAIIRTGRMGAGSYALSASGRLSAMREPVPARATHHDDVHEDALHHARGFKDPRQLQHAHELDDADEDRRPCRSPLRHGGIQRRIHPPDVRHIESDEPKR